MLRQSSSVAAAVLVGLALSAASCDRKTPDQSATPRPYSADAVERAFGHEGLSLANTGLVKLRDRQPVTAQLFGFTRAGEPLDVEVYRSSLVAKSFAAR